MANNRVQLYCKICLEAISLGKYYPPYFDKNGVATNSGWGLHLEEDSFFEFDEKHTKCFMSKADEIEWLWGEGMYGFRTEGAEDEYFTADNPYRIVKRQSYAKQNKNVGG